MLNRCVMALWIATGTFAVEPELAQLNFGGTNSLPAWVLGVEETADRTVIRLDRHLMAEDLAMALLYEVNTNADVAVQLFDEQNRVVVLDVFGNLMAVGPEAKTDTFILPLRKYPTATKIVLRQIRGEVKLYGATLFPVVTEAEADLETLEQLAKLLGDPLSPENPLVKGMQQMAGQNRIPLKWLPAPERSPSSSAPAQSSGATTLGRFDWHILPFPANSDWPGPRGRPARWENNELILTGHPVRTRRTYSLPVTVTYETFLEQRATNDGGLNLIFEPEGTPIEHQGEQQVSFSFGYGRNGVDDGSSQLAVWQLLGLAERFRPIGKLLWREENFQFRAGQTYRVKLEIRADGMSATVNGQNYEISGATVPYGRFHVTFFGWQPGNHWHVRNVSIR